MRTLALAAVLGLALVSPARAAPWDGWEQQQSDFTRHITCLL